MAWLLGTVGVQCLLLEGGYKGFRAWTRTVFAAPPPLTLVGGFTGSGKTRVLNILEQRGAAVIDLEHLARHRGSAFGGVATPGGPAGEQPTQEQFENDLAVAIWRMQQERGADAPLWMEDEAKALGRCRLPADLTNRMHGPGTRLYLMDVPIAERVRNILEDYGAACKDDLVASTMKLEQPLGRERAADTVRAIRDGRMGDAVTSMLQYYDKTYSHALQRKAKGYVRISATGWNATQWGAALSAAEATACPLSPAGFHADSLQTVQAAVSGAVNALAGSSLPSKPTAVEASVSKPSATHNPADNLQPAAAKGLDAAVRAAPLSPASAVAAAPFGAIRVPLPRATNRSMQARSMSYQTGVSGRRRVAVTGLGAVTPLATGVQRTWERLVAGDVAIQKLEGDLAAFPSQIAARVTRGSGAHEFDIAKVLDKGEQRTMGPDFIAMAAAATGEALRDAGLAAERNTVTGEIVRHGPHDSERVGIAVGSGIGFIQEIADTGALLAESLQQGQRKVSPYFVPRILINMAAGNVSIKYGLRGPNHAVSTACATGTHAIGDAFRFVAYGDADVMVAGGTEACISPLALAGFSRAKALATRYNDNPLEGSRPFDAARDGFVLGEGAGVMVLESWEHAVARGARIYAEISGYGLCGDAFHITAPKEDGSGAYRCMAAALRSAGLPASAVDYVNAHATSTPVGDAVEAHGLGRLFGSSLTRAALKLDATSLSPGGARKQAVAVSSTKGAIGHLLGAAGSVEAIFTVLALHTGQVPPTANLKQLDPSLPVDVCEFVGPTSVVRDMRVAMSNSFGFGGTNCSLVFQSATGDGKQ